ncbi:MAG: DUF1786 domain-containing protein [Chloroflexi bacterium]|nr:DUF1786 domain-containing protein [Chloroflexota bacterium]
MRILTVDIGTGTQDIFLYDSRLELENGFKLVAPSPTMMVHGRLREATRLGRPVLLTGVIMGGGPSQWATHDHLRAGYPVFATPAAARSFNDDLDYVQREMGIQLVSEDEAARLSADGLIRIELRDFDFEAIAGAFARFGLSLRPDAVAVAVFDHGDAPPGYSDRQFRFDYLDRRIRAHNRLSAFAFPAGEAPPEMTRLRAVAASAAGVDAPLMVMDTAPAAVLGATLDFRVGARERVLVANVGNFHTLAFRLGPAGIEGLFEHHTGEISLARLEQLLRQLADSSLQHQDVFDDMGHGALIYEPQPLSLEGGEFGVAVTGPRRNLMRESALRPYFAVPYGDMMIAGCFGLLRALADVYPEFREPILASLSGRSSGAAPWEA